MLRILFDFYSEEMQSACSSFMFQNRISRNFEFVSKGLRALQADYLTFLSELKAVRNLVFDTTFHKRDSIHEKTSFWIFA